MEKQLKTGDKITIMRYPVAKPHSVTETTIVSKEINIISTETRFSPENGIVIEEGEYFDFYHGDFNFINLQGKTVEVNNNAVKKHYRCTSVEDNGSILVEKYTLLKSGRILFDVCSYGADGCSGGTYIYVPKDYKETCADLPCVRHNDCTSYPDCERCHCYTCGEKDDALCYENAEKNTGDKPCCWIPF